MITSPPWANPAVLFFALTSCFRARRPRAARQRVSVGSFPSLGLSGVRRDGGPDTLLLAAHTIDGGLSLSGLLDR